MTDKNKEKLEERAAVAELSVKEVHERTGVPVSTLNLYCRNKTFPHARLVTSPAGNYWMIPESDLQFIPHRKPGRPFSKNKPA